MQRIFANYFVHKPSREGGLDVYQHIGRRFTRLATNNEPLPSRIPLEHRVELEAALEKAAAEYEEQEAALASAEDLRLNAEADARVEAIITRKLSERARAVTEPVPAEPPRPSTAAELLAALSPSQLEEFRKMLLATAPPPPPPPPAVIPDLESESQPSSPS